MPSSCPTAKGYYGWRIVALMFFTLIFTAGHGFYTFSVYMPRLIETLHCTALATNIGVAIWALVLGLTSPLVGTFMQRYGARRVLISATAAAGVVSLLLSAVTTIWQLYVVMALTGFATAASTLVPAQTIVTLWFRKYRGRAMALTLMGIGLGGLLLPWVTAYIITLYGWRTAYRITGVILFVVVLPPLVAFLRNRPGDVGQFPDGLVPQEGGDAASHGPTGVLASRAVRSAAFWLIFGIYLFQLFGLSALATNTIVFAEHQGFSIVMAALFMSFSLGATIPGRLVIGVLCDRVSPKALMVFTGLFLAAAPLALVLLVIRLDWIDYRAIAVFAVVQGIGSSMNGVVLPVFISRCFGEREFSKIMGLIMTGYAVGVIFGPTTAGHIFDKTGSYELAFYICAASAFLSAILALFVRPTALHPEFKTALEAETAAA